MVSHRSLDWTVTLRKSEYRSTAPLEQDKIVKIKILNKKILRFFFLISA